MVGGSSSGPRGFQVPLLVPYAQAIWTGDTLQVKLRSPLSGNVIACFPIRWTRRLTVTMLRKLVLKHFLDTGRFTSVHQTVRLVDGQLITIDGGCLVWNPTWVNRRIPRRIAKKSSLRQVAIDCYFRRR